MSRFRYSLHAALERSKAAERAARCALAAAERELGRERESLAMRDAERAATLRTLSATGTNVALVLSEVDQRLERLRCARRGIAERIFDAQRACARAREHVVSAQRERMALERHRARKHTEHLAAEALREAAELDESNARHGQRQDRGLSGRVAAFIR